MSNPYGNLRKIREKKSKRRDTDTSEEIEQWRTKWRELGVVRFTEEVLVCPPDVPIHPDYDGVPPFVVLSDDQEEFLIDISTGKINRFILSAGRGAGKTFIIAVYVAWRICCFDNFSITVMGGCYDKETEILTKNGWKFFKDVVYDDEIATLNKINNQIEYQKPTNIISYKYNDKMFHQSSEQVDLLVTPEHNMFVSHPKKKTFNLEPAEITYGKERLYKKNGIWFGDKKDHFVLPKSIRQRGRWKESLKSKYIPMEDWLKFFGLWLAEGWTYYQTVKGGHRYRISLRNNNTKLILELKTIMESNGFTVNLTDGGTVLVIDNKQLFDYLRPLGKTEEKYIPKEFLSLTSDQLKILLEYYSKGDGHLECNIGRTVPRLRTWTVSKRLKDDLQELALKIGISANYYNNGKKQSKTKDGRIIRGNFDSYCISYINKSNEPTVNPYKRTKKPNIFQRWEDYNDMVYCVTVPNHIIYVRRNGKPVWCGNSSEQSLKIKEYIDFWRDRSQEIFYCLQRSVMGGNQPARVESRWNSYSRFPACSETSSRGSHVTQLFIDEVSVGESKGKGGAKAVRSARYQLTASPDSLLGLTSTAHYILGTFYHTWTNAEELGYKTYRWSIARHKSEMWFIGDTKKPNWAFIDEVLSKDRNPDNWTNNVWWITEDDIQDFRRNSTDDEFLVELLGGMSRGSGLVFSRDDLKTCICNGSMFTEDNKPCKECNPYTDQCPMLKKLNLTLSMISNRKAGVDFGEIAPNALTVVGKRGNIVFVLYSDERTGLTTDEILKWIDENCIQYNIYEIFADPENYSMREALENRSYSVPNVWAGGTGGNMKKAYVSNVKRYIEQRLILIPIKFNYLVESLNELSYEENGDIRKHNDHSFDSLMFSMVDYDIDDEGSDGFYKKIENRLTTRIW